MTSEARLKSPWCQRTTSLPQNALKLFNFLYIVQMLFTEQLTNSLVIVVLMSKSLMSRHLELVLYSLQATEEVFGLAVDGEEPRGIPVDHDAEDKLLPLGTDPFKLVWDRDKPLHLPEIACSHLLKWRTELQTALSVHKKMWNKDKR